MKAEKTKKEQEKRMLPILPSSTLINCTMPPPPLPPPPHNNMLFGIQKADSTSIIRRVFFFSCRNKYANEVKPVTGNFKLSSLVLKKDMNLLIAAGQRNPIFVGIDYKAASVIMDAGGLQPGHGWGGQVFWGRLS